MKVIRAAALPVVFGVTALFGFGAGAADAGKALKIAERIFVHVDADKDGSMSPDEYAKGGLGRYGASFGDFDLDGDGQVTLAEYRTVFGRFHSGARQDAI